MHEEVMNFVGRVKGYFDYLFTGCDVLEIGSYDINGSVRSHFRECAYIGCDWRRGPAVDYVIKGHDLPFPPGSFDVAISAEVLEHDPFWERTVTKMNELIRPGGLVIITCAGEGRERHEVDCSPKADYYENRTVADLLSFADELILAETNRLGGHTQIAWKKAGRWYRMDEVEAARAKRESPDDEIDEDKQDDS